MLNYNLKQKEITLFGKKLILHERYMQDVFNLDEAARNNGNKNLSLSGGVYLATMLSDALKRNYDQLPWYSIKRWKIKRLTSVSNLIKNLGGVQFTEIVKDVYRLDGTDEDEIKKMFDIKKKLKEYRTAPSSRN